MKAHGNAESWTIPALLAASVLLGASGQRAAAGPSSPRDAPFQLTQADTTAPPGDDQEDDEDIPANLRDHSPPPGFPGSPGSPESPQSPQSPQSKDAAPDTTGAAAARDSIRTSLPAQPETLRYVQPGGPPLPGARTAGAKPGQAVGTAPPPKPHAALFGLGPVVIILGLAVIHFLVLRSVGG
jgi:hypothetical protein